MNLRRMAFVAGLALTAMSGAAGAQTLTQAGISDGFTLSTFYTGGGSSNYGIISATAIGNGNVVGSAYGSTQLMQFTEGSGNTVNNLTSANSILTTNSVVGTPVGLATVNGTAYVNVLNQGIYTVGTNGSLSLLTAMDGTYGIWAGPNNTVLASTLTGVVQINVSTGALTTVATTQGFVDGVTVNAAGTIVYAENNSHILGFSLQAGTYGQQVYDSGVLAVVPDGTGVINGGALNGDLVVSGNNGDICVLDTTTNVCTNIVTGLTRGDLVSADSNNGTLFVADYGQLLRLGLTGSTIGSSPNSSVPEPASMLLFGSAVAGFGAVRRRLRKRG